MQLVVKSIDISKMPGFTWGKGFALDDIGANVTLIYGPNGVGKTSLGKAFQAAFWPTKKTVQNYNIKATLQVEDKEVLIDLADYPNHLRGLEEIVDTSSLPSFELQDCYFLSLPDLLNSEERDLAKKIVQLSVGGFDLEKARGDLGWEKVSLRQGADQRGLACAKAALRRLEEKQEAVKNDEKRLGFLQDKIENGELAKKNLDDIESVISYKEIKDQFDKVSKKHSLFPQSLEKMIGDEDQRLKSIKEDLDSKKDRLKDEMTKIEEAKKIIDKFSFFSSETLYVKELRNYLQRLRNMEDSLRELTLSEFELLGRKNNALSYIGNTNLSDLKRLNHQDIKEYFSLLEQQDNFYKRKGALEELAGTFRCEKPLESDPLKNIYIALNSLWRWLEFDASLKRDRWTFFVTLFVFLVLLILLGSFIYTKSSLSIPILFSLFGVIVILWRLVPKNKKYMKKEEEQFLSLDINVNMGEWHQRGIRKVCEDLMEKSSCYILELERNKRYNDFLLKIEKLSVEEKDLSDKKEELVERMGLNFPERDYSSILLARNILAWQESCSDLDGLRSKISVLKEDKSNLINSINYILSKYHTHSVTDSEQLSAFVAELEEYLKQYEIACQVLHTSSKISQDLKDDIINLDRKWISLFECLGLQRSDEKGLSLLLDQFEDFTEIKREYKRLEILTLDKEYDLQGKRNYINLPLDDLYKIKDECKILISELGDAYKLKGSIEERIDRAKNMTEIESTLSLKDQYESKIRESRSVEYARAVGFSLIDRLQSHYQDIDRPNVFKKASLLFKQFTKGRYDLKVDDKNEEFYAFDCVEQLYKTVYELSSGNRVQLLIAVRLAFIEYHEGSGKKGVKLPLVIDEALANSDEMRAEELIQAAINIAKSGRQVVYLTARYDEVLQWKYLLDKESGIEHSIIEIDKKRRVKSLKVSSLFEGARVRCDYPEPKEGESVLEYVRRIGIESIDPFSQLEEVHLAYIIDCPNLLYSFLNVGVTRYGQLQNYLDMGESWLVKDHFVKERILANASFLKTYLKSYSIGRPKRLDPDILNKVVGNTFYKDIVGISESLGWDPFSLVDSLERRLETLPRFGKGQIEKLREKLTDEGYLDGQDPISSDQIWARALSVVDGSMLRDGRIKDMMQLLQT